MTMSEETSSGAEDRELIERLRTYANTLDRTLPPPSGAEIRRAAGVAVAEEAVERRRSPFLAAAAAVLLVAGLGAFVLGRSDDGTDTRLEAAASDESTAADDDTFSTTTEPEVEPATTTAPEAAPAVDVDLTPVPVAPKDFGGSDVRFLPSPEVGYTVASGSRLLLAESSLDPPASIPVRSQRVTLPAVDPADRRGIVIGVSTYADEAAADALLETEPTMKGVPGEPATVGDRTGTWTESEGFAPFSAGNPMRLITELRLRLDETTVLDVAAPDVSRAEIEELVESLAFDDAGALLAPTPPAGFETANPIDGLSTRYVVNTAPLTDYVMLSLVGGNGERMELLVSPKSAGLSPDGAHFDDADGYGWSEVGLFGEPTVTLVTPDVTLLVVSYSPQVGPEELLALARSVEPVDDATWTERLAIAPLFDAPVGGFGE